MGLGGRYSSGVPGLCWNNHIPAFPLAVLCLQENQARLQTLQLNQKTTTIKKEENNKKSHNAPHDAALPAIHTLPRWSRCLPRHQGKHFDPREGCSRHMAERRAGFVLIAALSCPECEQGGCRELGLCCGSLLIDKSKSPPWQLRRSRWDACTVVWFAWK